MKSSSNPVPRFSVPLASLLAGLVMSTASTAQVAGLYQGVTSQGQTIEVSLIDDGNGGLAFGGGTVFWQASCTRTGFGRNVAWGIGASVPLDGQSVTTEFIGNSLYERWRLFFAGNTVSGNFVGRTPEFVDPFASSRQVQLCDSGNLSFNGTLVPGAKAIAPLSAGQALQLK